MPSPLKVLFIAGSGRSGSTILSTVLGHLDGFISIERFESLSRPEKILSLSYWRDDDAVKQWRNLERHRRMQEAGRKSMFADYRLRVASVMRSYGMSNRIDAPEDSRRVHGA